MGFRNKLRALVADVFNPLKAKPLSHFGPSA